MSIDQRLLRNVLGQFATGVAIITANVDGIRLGATISSFNSVSLDPPLVLFNLMSNSISIQQWRAAKALSIFVLGDHQADLSNRFAGAASAKWNGLEERKTKNGSPWLPGAIVSFDCLPYANYIGGDHHIFVCEIETFTTVRAKTSPLIFHASRYRNLKPIEASDATRIENMWLHGW